MNLSPVNNLNFGQFVEIKKNVFVNTENIKHIYKNHTNTTLQYKDNFTEDIEIPYDTFMTNINNNQNDSMLKDQFVEITKAESINTNDIAKISEDQYGNATIEALGGITHYSNKKLHQFILDCSRNIKAQFINLEGKNMSNMLKNFGINEYKEKYQDK